MALAETANLAIRIDLEGNAQAGIAKLNKQLGGLQKGAGRVGKGVGQVGAGLARAGLITGGAAIAGIAAAAKAAIDFEDAFAGVRKTVNQTDLDAAHLSFEQLALDFRKMATEIPVTAVDLAKIGEAAGALGIRAADIETFTRTVAELGQTTNLSTDVAAEDLGKMYTILGLTSKGVTDFADTLVNLGNQGASTESEIIEVAKRFAAMGKQAGLTTNQILALSSAATSLGAEPEAAGSALSRIFGNMQREIANSTTKGKAFAKVTGLSISTLQKMVNKGQGLPILLDTLKGISKMSKTKAASTLKALGINNVRDVNAILLMSQNLKFVNDQLKIADKSKDALGKEFAKRVATTASKITLLKNNLTEIGIAMGTEVLPAVQRAIGKIIGVLQQPGVKSDFVQLGKDIAKAIDSINWDEVVTQGKEIVGILKGAVGWAKRLFDAFNALPGPIKEAGAGFLIIDKLSRGLVSAGVGNILGGLGESAIRGAGSKLPGVGRLFAQPVFVTNWPIGGIGGGVPGPGGKGGGGNILGALGLAGVILALAVPAGKAFAAALPDSWKGPAGHTGESEAQRRITQARGPGTNVLGPGVQEHLHEEHIQRGQAAIKKSVDDSKKRLEAQLAETKRETTRGVTATNAAKTAVNATKSAVQVGDNHVAATVSSSVAASTGAIVGAIFAARPVVNVTNVTKSTTIQERYGNGNGSQGTDALHNAGGH